MHSLGWVLIDSQGTGGVKKLSLSNEGSPVVLEAAALKTNRAITRITSRGIVNDRLCLHDSADLRIECFALQ